MQDVLDVSLHAANDVLLNFLKVFNLLVHVLHIFVINLFQVFSLVSHNFAK
jgi:hypothetical protein